jgi:Spy/CpxP family protein refolding chaperone
MDEGAIRQGVGEALGPLGDLAVLHARVRREIGAVLTPEQRQKAESLLEQFWSHRAGMRKQLHELGEDLLEDPS